MILNRLLSLLVVGLLCLSCGVDTPQEIIASGIEETVELGDNERVWKVLLSKDVDVEPNCDYELVIRAMSSQPSIESGLYLVTKAAGMDLPRETECVLQQDRMREFSKQFNSADNTSITVEISVWVEQTVTFTIDRIVLRKCEPAAPVITLESLLEEMVDRGAATYFPKPAYRHLQASSYDRKSVLPDQPRWFANNDGVSYVRDEHHWRRTEHVLCDIDGPGAVTRFWLATTNKKGTIRFYFDGANKPEIEIPAVDLLAMPLRIPEALCFALCNNTLPSEGNGCAVSFLPIPFSKHLKITVEKPQDDYRIYNFYQISYRKYEKGTNVRSFTLKEAERLEYKMSLVARQLEQPEAYSSGYPLLVSGTCSIDFPTGAHKIGALTFDVSGFPAGCYDKVMESLIVNLTFDGRKYADLPLSYFSGGGSGAPATNGWWLSSNGNGRIVCRFEMPYRESANITVRNIGRYPAKVSIKAGVANYVWNDRSLYFHINHKSEDALNLCVSNRIVGSPEWNFVSLEGRGVLMGDLMSVYNNSPRWYGEGDDRIWVDDDAFPSVFGTGTEDYYNFAFAPVRVVSTPYGGAPRADNESSYGYNAFLRTRNLDAIPFSSHLRFDWELLSWAEGTADFKSTVFWYGD